MKTITLSIITILFVAIQLNAQIAVPQNFFLGLEPMEEITMDEMDPEAEIDLTGVEHKIIAYFTVTDTLDISNIHISLGTSQGGTELYDSSFVFDDTELTEPREYIREGNNIQIVIGIYEWKPLFYSELKLENNNNEFSETINYLTN